MVKNLIRFPSIVHLENFQDISLQGNIQLLDVGSTHCKVLVDDGVISIEAEQVMVSSWKDDTMLIKASQLKKIHMWMEESL
ncbi:hypothetical protein [Paenisporosarcina cavernae]|uniref:Sporulation protein YqfC n=1 Tax=Paenisporosarcina cavernae TaxID=2320858 RepID=A0A385YUM0_9BACL|nr:hypothetical protein [Paenisporosarcina cavernae]AYC29617.1 hypothetical protein D3873_06850 [Paenisporosarcina cavernae]